MFKYENASIILHFDKSYCNDYRKFSPTKFNPISLSIKVTSKIHTWHMNSDISLIFKTAMKDSLYHHKSYIVTVTQKVAINSDTCSTCVSSPHLSIWLFYNYYKKFSESLFVITINGSWRKWDFINIFKFYNVLKISFCGFLINFHYPFK